MCIRDSSKLHQRLETTIIYVTHDQTEAMTLGTRIVVMKDGVVQQVGSPQNLYDNPCNKFVAGFIGTPPVSYTHLKEMMLAACRALNACGVTSSQSDDYCAFPDVP